LTNKSIASPQFTSSIKHAAASAGTAAEAAPLDGAANQWAAAAEMLTHTAQHHQ
jgi:hypothetical protein